MRHRTLCPLRWADLDLLGHVNNVRYVDYLRVGRDDLLRSIGVEPGPAGLVVDRHELGFRAPLLFGPEPVVVESWLTELTADAAVLEHVIHGGADDPTVHLAARSHVAARDAGGGRRDFTDAELAALAPYVEAGEPRPPTTRAGAKPDPGGYLLHLRAGDLDMTGATSDVAAVEFFQEARIAFLRRVLAAVQHHRLRWVVAQTNLDYLAPIVPLATPYVVSSRLASVGNRSAVVESVLRDEHGTEYAGARVVLVVFDPVTQRSAEPPEGYREVLEALVEGA